MGKIELPYPVKLICGLLAGDLEWLSRAKEILIGKFGPIGHESEGIPFDFTAYYQKELGLDIIRQYISFEDLIDPGDLASIKLTTNRMEEDLSEDGVRKVNLDPGYLDLSKMVLATTKMPPIGSILPTVSPDSLPTTLSGGPTAPGSGPTLITGPIPRLNFLTGSEETINGGGVEGRPRNDSHKIMQDIHPYHFVDTFGTIVPKVSTRNGSRIIMNIKSGCALDIHGINLLE